MTWFFSLYSGYSPAQNILQAFRIMDGDGGVFTGDDALFFQLFQFPVKGRAGDVHQHSPSGNALRNLNPFLSRLSRLHQEPERCFLRDSAEELQFKALLKHICCGSDFCREVLKDSDVFLHQ